MRASFIKWLCHFFIVGNLVLQTFYFAIGVAGTAFWVVLAVLCCVFHFTPAKHK